MEIVERKDLSTDKYRQTCPRCGSVLEWENSDVQVDRDGLYLECPVCGAFFIPDTSDPIPANEE